MQLILDPFCQAATNFDGATIFWTLFDHPDHCVLLLLFKTLDLLTLNCLEVGYF